MKRNNRQMIGVGVLAGVALGAAYAANRQQQYTRTGVPPMLNWRRVRSLAVAMNPEPVLDANWHAEWGAYYTNLVRRCEPLIAEEMGRQLPQPVQNIAAFSRAEWVDANIVSFEKLFAPLERLHQDSSSTKDLGTLLMTDVNQAVLSGELGVLMGYLARRVLGQYDLSLLGREPLTVGRLYMVEPNIAGVQQELGLDADDFRLWIALHETTHAFQFEAYPWVREYFNSLLENYFDLIIDDLTLLRAGAGGLSHIVNRARSNFSAGESWIEMVMTPEQRVLFGKLQSLMSVIEGYSNYIMNAVGARLLPSYDYIKQRIEERAAQRSPVEKLFIRLTGLALKMEQYRMGEAFINAVVAERGVAMANLVWEGPEYLPTQNELRDHRSWLARVEHLPAAAGHPTRSLDTALLHDDSVA
ncbi:MAG TPA: zinc-dependent metalloprotease [Chloroflexia bacterium]|nr:zinc-dependent metalloprotease [Chloroflexia bacterium]